jgi:Na+/H+-dicarboxylate symporter
VTWALAGGAAWLLIVATADGADHPVPVAAGMLLGLVLGQATAFELLVGMAGAALVAAVDPLDAAARAMVLIWGLSAFSDISRRCDCAMSADITAISAVGSKRPTISTRVSTIAATIE